MQGIQGQSVMAKSVLAAMAAILIVASDASSQRPARSSFIARYAFVNGVNMYYEIHGSGGTPLVLLHGAFSNIQTDFGKMLPILAKTRRVIAIEAQGHGHTADIGRPLTYEQMADDVAELLRQLDWPQLVNKIKDLDVNWRGLSADQVRSIKAPALLVVGDADVVRPEHVVEMFRLLGGAVPGDLVGLPRSQLGFLPGTTHVTLITKTDWLVSMAQEFFKAPMPAAK